MLVRIKNHDVIKVQSSVKNLIIDNYFLYNPVKLIKSSIIMRSTIVYSILFVVLLVLLLSDDNNDFSEGADILFYNGPIITMEKDQHNPEAVYIENGIIKSTGDYDLISKNISPATLIVDLKGKTLLPGFIDSHTHPAISAFVYDMIDLSGFTHSSKEELWNHFSDKISDYKPGNWILCKGFDQILVPGLIPPSISFLDSLAPDNPMLIASQSLHSYWANSLAFRESGINPTTPDPNISSYYERETNGNFTGYIAEQAAFEPFKKEILSSLGIKRLKENSLMVLKNYAKNGYTSITSMGITTSDKKVIQLYKHISSKTSTITNRILALLDILPKRENTVRNFIFLRYDAAHLFPSSSANGDDFFKIMGVKLWYDGSPYTGSMYLDAPYLDNNFTNNVLHIPSGHTGIPLLTKNQLSSYIMKYQSEGWQVAIHAQGDIAIRDIMNVFDDIGLQSENDFRHRIEHCILIDNESIEKMSKMNIHPSFHINHLYYYGDALENQIIGKSRADRMLPIRSAAENSLRFTLHADQPMFPSDPFSLLHTAVNRKTKEGTTLGKQNSISVYQGLEALTIHAAWQIKMDEKIGSIKEGKYADLVILDRNPLDSDKEDLRSIRVLDTYVHGNKINWNQ